MRINRNVIAIDEYRSGPITEPDTGRNPGSPKRASSAQRPNGFSGDSRSNAVSKLRKRLHGRLARKPDEARRTRLAGPTPNRCLFHSATARGPSKDQSENSVTLRLVLLRSRGRSTGSAPRRGYGRRTFCGRTK